MEAWPTFLGHWKNEKFPHKTAAYFGEIGNMPQNIWVLSWPTNKTAMNTDIQQIQVTVITCPATHGQNSWNDDCNSSNEGNN